MARQLAVRTVVAWFGKLSFDEQKDALNQFRDEHEKCRSAKRAELERQIAALGYDAPRRPGRPRSAANGNAVRPAARKGRRGKVKAKYRDPKTRETWSGRGRMARWLKAKQDAGENIAKYLA